MNKALATAVAAVLAMAMAAPAFAGSPGPRQQHQQRRIHHGLRDGSLTGREAVRLERGQARIHRMRQRFRADGQLTRRERARLTHRLDHASLHIWRARHNRFRGR